MRIEFFEDPLKEPHSREDVRFKQLGLYIFDDRRRVAVGFDITPFRERPSIDVLITNESGAEEASLSIIEAMQSNFNLTMHLRNPSQDQNYQVQAYLYYRTSDGIRQVVDRISRKFDLVSTGEM